MTLPHAKRLARCLIRSTYIAGSPDDDDLVTRVAKIVKVASDQYELARRVRTNLRAPW